MELDGRSGAAAVAPLRPWHLRRPPPLPPAEGSVGEGGGLDEDLHPDAPPSWRKDSAEAVECERAASLNLASTHCS